MIVYSWESKVPAGASAVACQKPGASLSSGGAPGPQHDPIRPARVATLNTRNPGTYAFRRPTFESRGCGPLA